MPDPDQIVEAILRKELNLEAPGPDTDLIETGLLDSLGLVTLVFEVEQRCGVSLPFESLDIDHFRSVRSIARLISEQTQGEAK